MDGVDVVTVVSCSVLELPTEDKTLDKGVALAVAVVGGMEIEGTMSSRVVGADGVPDVVAIIFAGELNVDVIKLVSIDPPSPSVFEWRPTDKDEVLVFDIRVSLASLSFDVR